MRVRMVPLVVSAVLLAAVGAGVPAGAAAPCPEKTVDLPIVDVILHADCTAEVEALSELDCFWGTVKESRTVGPVTVSYDRCAPPEEASPAPGPCPEATLDLLVEGSYVVVNPDCTVEVVLFPDIICVGPWTGHARETVGPVTVDVTYCRPPGQPIP